jgi:serine/threonine protein kinase
LLSRIPYIDTEFKSAEVRKAQADSNQFTDFKNEIAALRKLASNGSKHSPHLVDVLHAKQGDDGMVPTGFISYVLMTWCPGFPLPERGYFFKPQSEQNAIRQAFKQAWKYVNSNTRIKPLMLIPSD